MINRGLVDCDKAFSFLSPELKDLHDPFLFPDMDKAVERIVRAISRGERIVVYGDYDVDGVTSCSLVYLFLKEAGGVVSSYIPERSIEGYGLNAMAIKRLASDGVTLIITVDLGSSNHEEVMLAGSLGLDVIVTDHHEMPTQPPGAYAVINPKARGSSYPFNGLAGCGVAFKLVTALRSRLRLIGHFSSGREPNLKRYLDLVAIGTIADMVPLVDENRVLVSFGLKELAGTKRPGLMALKFVCDIRRYASETLSADSVAFQIAPRINAAGRMAKADSAFKLLTTDDAIEASALAGLLDRENRGRQAVEEEIIAEAVSMLVKDPANRDGKGLVAWKEGWHPGVIGIVASRLVERFGKPVVLIALDNGVGRGSGRGIRAFNILEGLKSCEGLLLRFGGHKAAAGLSVKEEDLAGFKAGFMRYVDSALTDEDMVPEITLDASVSLADVDMRLVSEIDSLAPFGVANAKPLFCLEGAEIVSTEVVKERHLRLTLRQNLKKNLKSAVVNGIGFGLAGLHPINSASASVAFSPTADEWQGVKRLSLKIRDVRVH